MYLKTKIIDASNFSTPETADPSSIMFFISVVLLALGIIIAIMHNNCNKETMKIKLAHVSIAIHIGAFLMLITSIGVGIHHSFDNARLLKAKKEYVISEFERNENVVVMECNDGVYPVRDSDGTFKYLMKLSQDSRDDSVFYCDIYEY